MIQAVEKLTYENIAEPVMDNLREKNWYKINMDNHTHAGIHKNQIVNNGYGILTSDEGHRFLSTVNLEQSKGEAERPVNRRQYISNIRIVNCRPVNRRQYIDNFQLSAFHVSGKLNGLFSFGYLYDIVR